MRGSSVVLFAAGFAAIALPVDGTLHAQDDSITGDEIVRMLADTDGPDVDLTGAVIEGDVDLSALQTIDRPIRCTRCRFTGRVDVSDVRFGGVVELIDATFEDSVDARGAVFGRAGVLDGARFEAELDASTSRFDLVGSFAGADFLGDVSFERATFTDRAIFTGTSDRQNDERIGTCPRTRGASAGPMRFAGATFLGPSQFRERCFSGSVDFSGARFASDVDFTVASFRSTANFERVAFEGAASFRVSDLGRQTVFDGASVVTTLSFDGAVVRDQLRLSALAGPGLLDLADVELCTSRNDEPEPPDDSPASPPRCSASTTSRLVLTRLAIAEVTVDLDDIDAIGGPSVQVDVLERVESTARARGDNAQANNAKFELLTRRNEDLSGIDRFFDGLFYRSIAGYLVRPTHPLAWFFVLVVIGTAVRTLLRSRIRLTHSRRRVVGSIAWIVSITSSIAASLAETLRTAFSVRLATETSPWNDVKRTPPTAPQPDADADSDTDADAHTDTDTDTDPDTDTDTDTVIDDAVDSGDIASLGAVLRVGAHRLEWLAFKVLIAVFLLGVANANSTVKQLIDSVF